MKEIIYIQAGTLSNYVGTHFWNTQESYFTYEEGDEPIVDHDISFREGSTMQGGSTFFPRLLLFDRKSNMGSISTLTGLYEEAAEEDVDMDAPEAQWTGETTEYRQEPIARSEYHSRLEMEAQMTLEEDQSMEEAAKDREVRYWSDYSRVFLHPRTLQSLPDIAEWESAEGDWNAGRDAFSRYNEENDLMEDSFRFLVEECDNLQGFQVMNDNDTFGSFAHSLLTRIRDEFGKLPCVTFSFLSSSIPGSLGVNDSKAIRTALNDALCLRSLNEMSTINLPLQSPATWGTGEWLEGLEINRRSHYHTSAILSTHIETATLPIKLKGVSDDLYSICGQLNGRGDTRFAHLSGIFPLHETRFSERDLEERLYDFSATSVVHGRPGSRQDYARIDVSRGFSPSDIDIYNTWATAYRPTPRGIHAPALPLPTSFPSFFTSPGAQSSNRGSRTHSARALSSLNTTPQTASLFSTYVAFLEDCQKRHPDVLQRMELEADEIKELRDDLWVLEDVYNGGE